jgi:hypothetical protein
MFRGHRIIPRTPEEAGLSQPELALRRSMQMGRTPLSRDTPDNVQAALDGLVLDFGPEAALLASYWAVSAWWCEQHGVWGHQDASCVHGDLSDAYLGRASWLSQQPAEEQDAIRQRAAAAHIDWEDAGRPGLIKYAASVRDYILSLRSGQPQNTTQNKEAV